MKSFMKHNFNWRVKVKLTEEGMTILKNDHEIIRSAIPSLGEFKEPETDENGFTTFQMHNLMLIFGSSMTISKELPFAMDAIVEVEP